MKPDQVPEELLDLAEDEFGSAYDGFAGWRSAFRAAFSVVIQRIRATERERCAQEIDCACSCRDAVLAAKTSADRARACGREPCAAVQAAAIRSLPEE